MQVLLFFSVMLMFISSIGLFSEREKDFSEAKARTIAQELVYYHNLAVRQCQETISVKSTSTSYTQNVTQTPCGNGIIDVQFPSNMQAVRSNYSQFMSVYVHGDGAIPWDGAMGYNDQLDDYTIANFSAAQGASPEERLGMDSIHPRQAEYSMDYIITAWNPYIQSNSWDRIYGLVASFLIGDSTKKYAGSWDTSINGISRNPTYTSNYAGIYVTKQVNSLWSYQTPQQAVPAVMNADVIPMYGTGALTIQNHAPVIMSYVTNYKTQEHPTSTNISFPTD